MKWNLELLYKNLDDPQIDFDIQSCEVAIGEFVNKWRRNTEYIKDPKVLKEALDEYEELTTNWGILTKPFYYILLNKEIDLNNKKVKGKYNQILKKATELENDIQFFTINLSKISKIQQQEFLNAPLLTDYKHYLENIFANSKYILTDKEEKIFNLTYKTSFDNWINMVEELLNKQTTMVLEENGSKKEVPYNEVFKYYKSKDKEVRDYAAKQMNKINRKYIEIAEYEMNSILEDKQINDNYRGIKRVDLPRHINDDMDSKVVDTLVDVVTKNFDISKQFYKEKANMLGQKTIGYHERGVPVGEIKGEYKFENSIKLVKKVFNNIDPQFKDIVQIYEDNGQYEVFPRKDKSGGAFCTHINKNLPTYILLNHTDKLNDVLTIAHESGHGIHSELVKEQNSLNDGYSTALAEVASTFFEDFVFDEVLSGITDKGLRTVIEMERRSDEINTIFRQVAFYNFELELHTEFRKRGFLSHEEISDIFVKHMVSYLGDSVDVDESMRLGWIYVSHFRRFFYVYTYASGLLISKYLQSKVREDIKFVSKVKDFLKAGSSKSPKDIFLDMGIDISKREFWEEGVKSIRL